MEKVTKRNLAAEEIRFGKSKEKRRANTERLMTHKERVNTAKRGNTIIKGRTRANAIDKDGIADPEKGMATNEKRKEVTESGKETHKEKRTEIIEGKTEVTQNGRLPNKERMKGTKKGLVILEEENKTLVKGKRKTTSPSIDNAKEIFQSKKEQQLILNRKDVDMQKERSIESREQFLEKTIDKNDKVRHWIKTTKSSNKRTHENKEVSGISRKRLKQSKDKRKSREKPEIIIERDRKTYRISKDRPKKTKEEAEVSVGSTRTLRRKKGARDVAAKSVKRARTLKIMTKKSKRRNKHSKATPLQSEMQPEYMKPPKGRSRLGTEALSDDFSPYEEDVVYGPEANLQEHYDNCRKNPKHEQFIPVTSFGPDHLPARYHKKSVFELVKTLGELTVKLTVTQVSNNRPEIFNEKPYPLFKYRGQRGFISYGTGRVVQVKMFTMTNGHTCPCSNCKQTSTAQEWAQIRVATATHVVFDDEEAEHTVVSFGCDSDTSHVTSISGSSVKADVEGDVSNLFCATHDLVLAEKLAATVEKYKRLTQKVFKKYENNKEEEKLVIIVSHPHGCPKQVSIGQWTNKTDIVKQEFISVCVDTEDSDESQDSYYKAMTQKWDPNSPDDDFDNSDDIDNYDYDYDWGNGADESDESQDSYYRAMTQKWDPNSPDEDVDNSDAIDNYDYDWGLDADEEDESEEDSNKCLLMTPADCETNEDLEGSVSNDIDNDNGCADYDSGPCLSDSSDVKHCYDDYYIDCDDVDDDEYDDYDSDLALLGPDYEYDYEPPDFDSDYYDYDDLFYDGVKTQMVANSYTCSKYLYTACTCPGSSGATVFLFGRDDWTTDHLHSTGTAAGNCSGYAFKHDL